MVPKKMFAVFQDGVRVLWTTPPAGEEHLGDDFADLISGPEFAPPGLGRPHVQLFDRLRRGVESPSSAWSRAYPSILLRSFSYRPDPSEVTTVITLRYDRQGGNRPA